MARRHKASNSGKTAPQETTLRERIELRAYELFELRKRGGGFDLHELVASQAVLVRLEQF